MTYEDNNESSEKRFPAFLMTLVMLAACLSGLPISEGYASVTPTVTLADWTYGETPNDPVASGFAGPVSYTYYMYFSTSSGTPQDLTSSSADRGGADTDGKWILM